MDGIEQHTNEYVSSPTDVQSEQLCEQVLGCDGDTCGVRFSAVTLSLRASRGLPGSEPTL